MPNSRPRGERIWRSKAIVQLAVPEVDDPQDLLNRALADRLKDWPRVLIAVNPELLPPKRRRLVVSEFARLLTRVTREYRDAMRSRNGQKIYKTWKRMKQDGKRPSASRIAKSLGIDYHEARKVVTLIRAHEKPEAPRDTPK